MAITDEEVDILYENNVLGVSSGESLLNTVWLIMNNIFWNAWLSRARDLCWWDVKQRKDPQGNKYL